jgi:hypothetical protein
VKKPKEEKRPKIVELPQEQAAAPTKEILGKDIVYIKDSIGSVSREKIPLYRNKPFLYLQLLPILFFLSAVIFHARQERLRKDVRYARLLKAPKKAKRGIGEATRLFSRKAPSGEFYGAVFKTLQGYLGDRLHLPSAGITAHVIDETLKPRGVDGEILKKVRGLFEECDLARYAPSSLGPDRMGKALNDLKEVINYFERARI